MRIGIAGYGNLGKGVECALKQNPDMTLAGVFTRRNPKDIEILTEGVNVYNLSDAVNMKDEIDVMIICGGSATDLPTMTPELAKSFNVIDSFDNHSSIPEHFEKVDKAATENGHIGIISVGWDPGLFSLNRVISSAVLPKGNDYTFWGKGVSQGHSNAVRKVEGVVDAKQYTIPIESALDRVRSGENPTLAAGERHKRECFVVAEDGENLEIIESEIVNMPAYFADYETSVHFISHEDLERDHSGIPHGGHVIRTGSTGWNEENKNIIEYSLKLESNPEFTSSVLVAYARAAYRMNTRGLTGCKTILDVAPGDLSAISPEELRRTMI